MRQSGLPEGHSNAAVKQHGLLRRLTSRIGGGMDGKKRAKGCAKQRVEDFATRISQVLAANSAGTGAVGAQAPRFPDRAQREEARRQFSLRRKTERKEGTKAPHPRAYSNLFPVQLLLLSLHQPNTQSTTANMLIYKVRLSDCFKGPATRATRRSLAPLDSPLPFDSSTPLCFNPQLSADSTCRMFSAATR